MYVLNDNKLSLIQCHAKHFCEKYASGTLSTDYELFQAE